MGQYPVIAVLSPPQPPVINKESRLSEIIVKLRTLEQKLETEVPFGDPDYEAARAARFGISEFMTSISLVAASIDEKGLTDVESFTDKMISVANIFLSEVSQSGECS